MRRGAVAKRDAERVVDALGDDEREQARADDAPRVGEVVERLAWNAGFDAATSAMYPASSADAPKPAKIISCALRQPSRRVGALWCASSSRASATPIA